MGIIINDDFEIYTKYLWKKGISETAGEREARSYIRRYADTQVSAICFNVNAQLSGSPSEVIETVESRYLKKEVDGIPVDFTNTIHKGWYDQFIKKGLDLYEIFFDECRACGISPWLSVRPNDTHDNLDPTGGLHQCDYTHTARREGRSRCTHRDVTGYFDNCLDFGVPAVRERFLAYVKEQILRYDADGVEIDFMREPFLFRPGYEEEGRAILRDMMREIRSYTRMAAEKHGHPVLLSVRTLRDPESDFYAGIDSPTLAREGIVDAVTVSPRWETSDSDIPLSHWRAVLPKQTRLSLAAEMNYRSATKELVFTSPELMRGLACYAHAAGADDFYMFNYSYLAPPTGEGFPTVPEAEPYLALLKEVGDLETVKPLARRHMISYNDLTAYGMQTRPTLPIKVTNRHETSALRFFTGPFEKEAYLLLDVDAPAEELSVYLNAAPVRYLGKAVIEEGYAKSPVLVFETNTLRPVTQILEVGLLGEGSATLRYAELRTDRPALV